MEQRTEHVYTPSELNREIKLHLEMGFPRVVLEAEISNLARPASGHLYFSLKDDRAQIRCAMFRSSATRMTIRPENGLKVLARGRISLYEPRGEYQFIVDSMQDAGEGELQRQFEELKKKLESEGLFDPAHKKPLLPYPSRIALVTSPTGAAVRDLVHVLGRRWPMARVRLYPVRVQGDEAPGEVLQAIKAVGQQGWADTLIIGRGGGSLEDLAAFNDEAVARAVFSSPVPVISAVGHETDFSICDFVADLRAPTPSAAAELATPDQATLKASYERTGRQLERRMHDRLQKDIQRLDHHAHRLQQQNPAKRLKEQEKRLRGLLQRLRLESDRSLSLQETRLNALTQRLTAQRPVRKLAELSDRLSTAQHALLRLASETVRVRRDKLAGLARTLNAVSPLELLGRGYAIVTLADSHDVVTSVKQIRQGDRLSTRLGDGSVESTVDSID